MTYIPPSEQAGYDTRRRRASDTYQQGLANVEYKRGSALQNQGLEATSLNQRFDQMRRNLPGGYAKRNMLNSGIYHQGLQDYAQGRQGAQSDLAARYQQMLGGLNQESQGLNMNYNTNISEVYDMERARRAEIAASLSGYPQMRL